MIKRIFLIDYPDEMWFLIKSKKQNFNNRRCYQSIRFSIASARDKIGQSKVKICFFLIKSSLR